VIPFTVTGNGLSTVVPLPSTPPPQHCTSPSANVT
jgi:hypothetical protein